MCLQYSFVDRTNKYTRNNECAYKHNNISTVCVCVCISSNGFFDVI